jgi:YegS/Rv2252/BmrU family lipid kinase
MVNTYVTAKQKDAIDAVKRFGEGMDLIVCCGGDGTFNETITGLLESGLDIPVGYIPAGSTNDFAASLKLPVNAMQAVQHILEGQSVSYDVGRFGNRYFSYIASFGAFTRSSYATPQSLKNLLGHTAYLLSGVTELARIRSQHLKFTLEDGTVLEDDYIFGAISNSTSVAGVLTLDPKRVDLHDGLLELLLVRKPHSLLEMSDCIIALTNQDYSVPMITLKSTAHVEIEAPADMDWTLDGEHQAGSAHCTVENLHNAIYLVK